MSALPEQGRPSLPDLHPQSLRAGTVTDPQLLGDVGKREIGQVFEEALDRARLTKQEAAFLMGYTDSGVIGRWVNGTERVQMDKLWMLGDRFKSEFVIALAQTCHGVETKTLITLAKVG